MHQPQTLNPYSYTHNNPVRKIDPSGLYELDFHFSAVYYILRAKGFTSREANQVAGFSQGVDDNPATEPLWTSAENRAKFHFSGSGPEQATIRNDPTARANVVAALKNLSGKPVSEKQARALGGALHTYADTWSHEGFTAWHSDKLNRRTGGWRPNVGHADAAEGGTAPDRPCNDVEKALEAARNIYDLLPSRGKTVPWQEVEKDLRAAFSLQNQKEKERADQLNKRSREKFGDENVSYEKALFDH
jgi:hypothetical protein